MAKEWLKDGLSDSILSAKNHDSLTAKDVFDAYGLLKESGIDYVVVEDTGKTFPTVEMKAPFLVVSKTTR